MNLKRNPYIPEDLKCEQTLLVGLEARLDWADQVLVPTEAKPIEYTSQQYYPQAQLISQPVIEEAVNGPEITEVNALQCGRQFSGDVRQGRRPYGNGPSTGMRPNQV